MREIDCQMKARNSATLVISSVSYKQEVEKCLILYDVNALYEHFDERYTYPCRFSYELLFIVRRKPTGITIFIFNA